MIPLSDPRVTEARTRSELGDEAIVNEIARGELWLCTCPLRVAVQVPDAAGGLRDELAETVESLLVTRARDSSEADALARRSWGRRDLPVTSMRVIL